MIMLEFYVLNSIATIGVCEPGVVCVFLCILARMCFCPEG